MSKEPFTPGTTVNDRYVLGRKLGSDGEVYEAYDRYLDQTVAFKLLRPRPGAVQSWDEAKRLEQLRSRFIVPVLNADVITTSDLRYIVTRLLPDGDLASEALPHGLPSGLASRLGQNLASGLDAVHASEMVHRDVKPGNALLDGDIALVSDLEFCSTLDARGTAPRNGSWCTLAPEVATDEGLCSVASDIYSLAATVFYLMSGEYPVDHRLDLREQRRRIILGEVRHLVDLAPHVPQAVANVVKRGMSFDPTRRHASAIDFGNRLATATSGRRSWRRVSHDLHAYCAESDSAVGPPKAIGVCSVPEPAGRVSVRAFHLATGRALRGHPRDLVSADRLAPALRSLFGKVS